MSRQAHSHARSRNVSSSISAMQCIVPAHPCSDEQPGAGSPLGTYEQETGAQQGLLRTVLRGGHVAQTPMVLPAAVQGGAAVATIIHRIRPGGTASQALIPI